MCRNKSRCISSFLPYSRRASIKHPFYIVIFGLVGIINPIHFRQFSFTSKILWKDKPLDDHLKRNETFLQRLNPHFVLQFACIRHYFFSCGCHFLLSFWHFFHPHTFLFADNYLSFRRILFLN